MCDTKQISQRQDAVNDLVQNKALYTEITEKLTTLPDIERILSKIFTYSIKGKIKAFYVDAQALKRLDEFYKLLEVLKDI